MHAGSLAQEFDQIYTQKGHGRQLRANHRKLTIEDLNADLQVHERIVFCHVLDMRDSVQKKMQAIAANDAVPDDARITSQEKHGPYDSELRPSQGAIAKTNTGPALGAHMVDESSDSQLNQNKILRKRAKKFDHYPDHKTLQKVNGDQVAIDKEVDDLCLPLQKRNGRYGPRGKYKKRQNKNEKSITEARTRELLFGNMNELETPQQEQVIQNGPHGDQFFDDVTDEKSNGLLHFNNVGSTAKE